MGFLIENIKTRDGEGVVHIRGCDDGNVEFVRPCIITDPKTKEERDGWAAYKFYASIEMALNKVFRMRVCNRDASTLEELLQNVKEEREALHAEFESKLMPRRTRR